VPRRWNDAARDATTRARRSQHQARRLHRGRQQHPLPTAGREGAGQARSCCTRPPRSAGRGRCCHDQLDAVAAAAKDELAPAPSAGMAARMTRSQAHVETLDDAIAELFYAENLPEELADSARWHKLLNLMGSAPIGYEPPSVVGWKRFAAARERWSERVTKGVRSRRAESLSSTGRSCCALACGYHRCAWCGVSAERRHRSRHVQTAHSSSSGSLLL
jgi:hypothetical protein